MQLRMKCLTGVTQRMISSTAVGISDGSSRSRCSWSGCSTRACMPAGHRRRRRVVAGGGDDHVVRDRLHHAERLAVERGVGDDRRQVVGRVGPAVLGQLGEVDEEVVDDGDRGPPSLAPGQLLVGRAEQLLGQLQHARVVATRAARGWPGSPAAGTAWRCRGRSRTRRRARPSVDGLHGQLGQPGVELGHVLRQEPLGGHRRGRRGGRGRPCGSASAAARRAPRGGASPARFVMTGRGAFSHSLLCSSISSTSACLVTTWNGAKSSVSTRWIGSSRRSTRAGLVEAVLVGVGDRVDEDEAGLVGGHGGAGVGHVRLRSGGAVHVGRSRRRGRACPGGWRGRRGRGCCGPSTTPAAALRAA